MLIPLTPTLSRQGRGGILFATMTVGTFCHARAVPVQGCPFALSLS